MVTSVLYFFRLVFDMDDVFGVMIIIDFLWGLSTMCGTLLMVQMELVEFSPPAFSQP